MTKDILIYKTEDGKQAVEVKLDKETVWLTQNDLSLLFKTERSVITKHINNIFKTSELHKKSVCAKFAHTASDGKTYQTNFYNLDMIISVGYRVNSKRGTQFRIWATNVLRNYLVEGYALNEKRLNIQKKKYEALKQSIEAARNIAFVEDVSDEAKGLVEVLNEYTKALDLLDDYDHQKVTVGKVFKKKAKELAYDEAVQIIREMKERFKSSTLFGVEKDDSFKGSIENIYQTFSGKDLYPSLEEKAAHLLYFLVKNHSFLDGNKRIAAALFVCFLKKNNMLFKEDSSQIITNNALVALTLMIAESHPKEKDILMKIIVNLII